MAKRTAGRSKLTAESRRRLAELVGEVRSLLYGEAGCPAWGTSFEEIECDAKEAGHEIIRLTMEQTVGVQAERMPAAALVVETGETPLVVGRRSRTVETESGRVTWDAPAARLPKSRKDFSPSGPQSGPAGR